MNKPKDRIHLVKPSAEHRHAVLEYRDEFLHAHETIHGSGGLDRFETFEEWLQAGIDGEHEETMPKGRVPATQFLAVRESDGGLVGMIQVRHSLNDYLKTEGGNIGYSVRQAERRKGYATQMLNAALSISKEFGLKRVLITCDPDNIASMSVIKANGGTYEKQVATGDNGKLNHYWVTIS